MITILGLLKNWRCLGLLKLHFHYIFGFESDFVIFVEKMAMATQKRQPTKLNTVQISLLRLFEQRLSSQDTLTLRRMMMEYFDQQLKAELDTVLAQKQYSTEDFERMLNNDSFGLAAQHFQNT
ncbi:MAG TPA: hypothetical protein DCM71_11065 [Runella sp.]|nr:hypothetical protein [Runella sp.]